MQIKTFSDNRTFSTESFVSKSGRAKDTRFRIRLYLCIEYADVATLSDELCSARPRALVLITRKGTTASERVASLLLLVLTTLLIPPVSELDKNLRFDTALAGAISPLAVESVAGVAFLVLTVGPCSPSAGETVLMVLVTALRRSAFRLRI